MSENFEKHLKEKGIEFRPAPIYLNIKNTVTITDVMKVRIITPKELWGALINYDLKQEDEIHYSAISPKCVRLTLIFERKKDPEEEDEQ